MGVQPFSVPAGQLDEPAVHIVEMRMVIACPCQPHVPLLIRSVHEGAVCAACQRKFVIAMMRFDRREDQSAIHFAVGVQHPTIVRPT